MIRVTIWNEYLHEVMDAPVAALYPQGMHNTIADFLKCDDICVRTATLEEPECGLTQEVLDDTDVLIWWGHGAHARVPDEIAQRVCEEVRKGMGFIALHSSHLSKPFRMLMGTSCTLGWRHDGDGDKERIWVVNPAHPIAKGIDSYFELPHVETYGEPFGIPNPDEVVFIGWYEGGEVFRSGCTFHRENGRIFYFQPGHELYPIFHDPNVQTVIKNAVYWAAPQIRQEAMKCWKLTRIEN